MSVNAPAMVIVAGWYPDPADNTLARWWDGTQWTPTTREIDEVSAPAIAEAAPTSNQYFSPVPVRTDASLPPIDPYRPLNRRDDSQGFVSMGVKAAAHFQPTRAYTGAVWAIATLPIWSTFSLLALALALGELYSSFLIGVTGFVLFVICVAFATHDQKVMMNSLHSRVASPWWMLLGPFVYLIVRGVHVSRTLGRGWVPLIVYLICCFVPTAAILAFSSLFAFVSSFLNGIA